MAEIQVRFPSVPLTLSLVTVLAIALAAQFPAPATASAQPRFAATAFEDPVARQLYTAAYNRWHALDTTIAGYTAVIRQRVATAIRTPLKDRLVFSNEHAVRTFWNRGRRPVVKVLGDRTRHPGRNFALARGEAGWLDAMPYAEPFVPGSDHLFFGWDREQEIGPPGIERRSIIHPLAEGGDLVYRFRSGDTITLSLPDGRRVQAVGLEVVPCWRTLSESPEPVDRSRVRRTCAGGVQTQPTNRLPARCRVFPGTRAKPCNATYARRLQAGEHEAEFPSSWTTGCATSNTGCRETPAWSCW